MDKKFSALIIVSAFAFLVVGLGVGVVYQKQADASQVEKSPKTKAINILSSKIIPSITAFGEVTKIDGKNITLSFGGDNLTVKINDDAQIYFPARDTKDENGKPITAPQKIVKFSDIKIRDDASINVKLLTDVKMEGQLVVVLQ